MPNLNGLIYTSSDYKMALSAVGPTGLTVKVPLTTVESFDYGSKVEGEYIHVVGDKEPIGHKTNTSTYPGKLTLQAGELEIILKAIGAVMATQISNATITIIALNGAFAKIAKNVDIMSHDGSVKAKDKQSLITLNYEGLGFVGI